MFLSSAGETYIDCAEFIPEGRRPEAERRDHDACGPQFSSVVRRQARGGHICAQEWARPACGTSRVVVTRKVRGGDDCKRAVALQRIVMLAEAGRERRRAWAEIGHVVHWPRGGSSFRSISHTFHVSEKSMTISGVSALGARHSNRVQSCYGPRCLQTLQIQHARSWSHENAAAGVSTKPGQCAHTDNCSRASPRWAPVLARHLKQVLQFSLVVSLSLQQALSSASSLSLRF